MNKERQKFYKTMNNNVLKLIESIERKYAKEYGLKSHTLIGERYALYHQFPEDAEFLDGECKDDEMFKIRLETGVSAWMYGILERYKDLFQK